ncbi:hypothetical protein IPA_07195 [Ignicoccus pacificus DSM 13166]|uniref:Uncharacterized protein n=1 Tax=Ignicoccus pacificus DSM 13166 TaxID=940294 RepID=A0A977KD11_9CREN|nr:hypothetical protein IPA_07195 [Ignicoccus pacificus DSM 13166]
MGELVQKPLKKIIVVAGITGLNLSNYVREVVAAALERNPDSPLKKFKIINFEKNYLRELTKVDIIPIILDFAHLSRSAFLNRFKEALKLMCHNLKCDSEDGVKHVILITHISYITTSNELVPNPILPALLELAEEVKVIYLFDDWYDILRRLAERQEELKKILSPGHVNGRNIRKDDVYPIDPLLIMSWRAADVNILTFLTSSQELALDKGSKLSFVKPFEFYIFALKYPLDTHIRFFEMLASDLEDALSYTKAYVSHPISIFRRIRREDQPLKDVKGVCDVIEKTKKLLRDFFPKLILFEPTTIDELVLENVKRGHGRVFFAKLMQDEMSGKDETDYFKKLETCKSLVEEIEAALLGEEPKGSEGEEDKKLSMVIDCMNRWPFEDVEFYVNVINRGHPKVLYPSCDQKCKPLHDELGFLKYVNKRFRRALALDIMFEVLEHSYIAQEMLNQINSQIELRDYLYVEQSDILIVILPILYTINVTDHDGESALNMDFLIHMGGGVEAEIQRAKARAMGTVYLLIPTPLDKDTFDALQKNPSTNSVKGKAIITSSWIHQRTGERVDLNEIKEKCLEKYNSLEYSDASDCENKRSIIRIIYDEFNKEAVTAFGETHGKGPFTTAGGGTVVVTIASKEELERKFKYLIKLEG